MASRTSRARSRASRIGSPCGPWTREIKRILERVREFANEGDALQSILIEEPGGAGAERVLEGLVEAARAAAPEGVAVVATPPRLDSVHDWPSLAAEILVAAWRSGAPHGADPAEIERLRAELGPTLYRDELDKRLRAALEKHGALAVMIDRLDVALAPLEENDDDWALRNVLQSYPLGLVATAGSRWRPGRNRAFYEFFDRLQLSGYTDAEIGDLIAWRGLGTEAARTLGAAADRLARRPALVEAMAAELEQSPELDLKAALRRVARRAAFLEVDLAGLSVQQRRMLAALVAERRPAPLKVLDAVAGLSPAASSTMLGRLIEAGVVRAEPPIGRNRAFDFADEVWGVLFQTLSSPTATLDARKDAASPPGHD